MARYDVSPAWFVTPRGNTALIYLREGTNDWNTAYSCLTEDEYGTRDLPLTGRFLDVGGYLGTASIAILVDNPDTHAIIVEPIPDNLELIRRNLEANDLTDRATVIEGVVGKGETTIHYAFEGNESDLHHAFVGNSGETGTDAGPHRTVTYTGLSYRELVGSEDVAFIKIDCEGGEWPVLHEMAAVPLIVGEIHPVPLPDGAAGSRELLNAILGATHDITYGGPEGSPAAWGFRAQLHAGRT